MKIIKSEAKIEINVPPNKEFKNTLIFIAGGLVLIPFFLFSIFTFLKSLLNWNFNMNFCENFFGMLVMFLALNYSLWLLIGKEKVIFKENVMIFTITNGIFRVNKYIEIDQINSLTTADKVYNSDLPFIKDSGRIKFKYKREFFSILRGLKDDEIKEVSEIFKEQINKKTLHTFEQ